MQVTLDNSYSIFSSKLVYVATWIEGGEGIDEGSSLSEPAAAE